MITPAEISAYGERHVEAYLTSTGYRCNMSKSSHGSYDIEARGEDENLFVHVMTAVEPNPVPELTSGDLARVLSFAMRLGYDAWLAKVTIATNGELAAEIEWSQLNH